METRLRNIEHKTVINYVSDDWSFAAWKQSMIVKQSCSIHCK